MSEMEQPEYSVHVWFRFIDRLSALARRQGFLEVPDLPEKESRLPPVRGLCHRFSAAQNRPSRLRPQFKIMLSLMAGRWSILLVTGVSEVVGHASLLLGPVLLGNIVAGLTCRQSDGCSWDADTVYLCALICLYSTCGEQ
jgi:hypothetical protein